MVSPEGCMLYVEDVWHTLVQWNLDPLLYGYNKVANIGQHVPGIAAGNSCRKLLCAAGQIWEVKQHGNAAWEEKKLQTQGCRVEIEQVHMDKTDFTYKQCQKMMYFYLYRFIYSNM